MTAKPHNLEEPLIKTEYTDIKTEDIEDPEPEYEVPKPEAENEDVRWPSSAIGCNFSDFKERGKVLQVYFNHGENRRIHEQVYKSNLILKDHLPG